MRIVQASLKDYLIPEEQQIESGIKTVHWSTVQADYFQNQSKTKSTLKKVRELVETVDKRISLSKDRVAELVNHKTNVKAVQERVIQAALGKSFWAHLKVIGGLFRWIIAMNISCLFKKELLNIDQKIQQNSSILSSDRMQPPANDILETDSQSATPTHDPSPAQKDLHQSIAHYLSPLQSSSDADIRIVNLCGIGKHKIVCSIEGTNLVVKTPISALNVYKFEYLAYRASELLHLHVVPFVSFSEKGQDLISPLMKKIDTVARKVFPQNGLLIFQSQINPNQQESIQLDVSRAHQVLFFNLIIGRSDSIRANSIIDENNRVWEIDNDWLLQGLELISTTCFRKHWLSHHANIWNASIDDAVLNEILSLNSENVSVPLDHTDPWLLKRWSRFVEIIKKRLATVQASLRALQTNRTPITFDVLLTKIQEKQSRALASDFDRSFL